MSRHPDSGKLDLAEVFRRSQSKMMSDLLEGNILEHGPSQGAASEMQWLKLLAAYLPKRYRAASAFIVNGSGDRSRQIDIAIYDDLYSPPLFPHAAGIHIPVESVYAVLEVKSRIDRHLVKYAGVRAASVRELREAGDKRPILAGMLTTVSDWHRDHVAKNLWKAMQKLPPDHRLDLGCAMDQFAFEFDGSLTVSAPEEALIFFVLRLIERLNALGPAPAVDLMRYVRGIGSFKKWV